MKHTVPVQVVIQLSLNLMTKVKSNIGAESLSVVTLTITKYV